MLDYILNENLKPVHFVVFFISAGLHYLWFLRPASAMAEEKNIELWNEEERVPISNEWMQIHACMHLRMAFVLFAALFISLIVAVVTLEFQYILPVAFLVICAAAHMLIAEFSFKGNRLFFLILTLIDCSIILTHTLPISVKGAWVLVGLYVIHNIAQIAMLWEEFSLRKRYN